MQNKPNFKDAEINANSVFTRDYEDFMLYKSQQNKAKTNPILSAVGGFPKSPNECKLTYNKGLQKKR